jgi:hypothetical protein
MFIVNLFGFVMITSTIVIGVLFFNKASAIEKEIELEIITKSRHNKDEAPTEDYDISDSDSELAQSDDDTVLHAPDDLEVWEEDETTV